MLTAAGVGWPDGGSGAVAGRAGLGWPGDQPGRLSSQSPSRSREVRSVNGHEEPAFPGSDRVRNALVGGSFTWNPECREDGERLGQWRRSDVAATTAPESPVVVPDVPDDPGRHADRPRGRGGRRRPRRGQAGAMAAARAVPDHDDRQPEGRRGQDHHRGQPGGEPVPARHPGAGGGPGPAGQRVDRAGRGSPRRARVGVQRARRGAPAVRDRHRGRRACPASSARPATIDLAGAEIELVPMVARERGCRARSSSSTCPTSTTC